MLSSAIPRKFNLPFAVSAGGSFSNYPIPDSPPGTPGLASLTTGFPSINFTPVSGGGIPPAGADFNAILFQITSWNQWQAAGGPIPFDATFSASIGGYPNGAIVGSVVVPGNFWQSTTDNNTSNPDSGGANWITPPAMKGTGDWFFRPVSDALANHVIMNGTTIGSAASGATQLASSTALFIYQYLWNKFSNTQCPVTGGRGANAAADFNANKPLQVLNMQGTGITGVDGMGGTPTGLLANVPVVSGSATIPGSVLGENLHTLVVAELAQHTPTGTVTNQNQLIFNIGSGAGIGGGGAFGIANASTLGLSMNSIGSNTPHNNVQRSMIGYWFLHI